MLRINPSSNAAGAAKYFDEGLQRADYFSKEEHCLGQWHGRLAERLGLGGTVAKADFVALAHNRTPDGKKLNPRDSTTRKVGYDFTFSVPKSVSLAYAIGGDERIRDAFEQAVEATMQELESEMRTQTGQGKNKQHVPTGEMVWASFTHRTSRPVNGIPDPHLHRHAFAFNTTWNAAKGRYQAGEFRRIKEDAAYYEAAFESRMALAMRELGYQVERRGLSWEIKGFDQPLLAKFSRRTQQVEERAAKEEAGGEELTAKQREKLGSLTRAMKLLGQSWESLCKVWKSWLSNEESTTIRTAVSQPNATAPTIGEPQLNARHALRRAEQHLFERKSVVKQSQLKAEALKRSYGSASPEDVDRALTSGDYYQRELKGRHYVTTRNAVEEEVQMLNYARAGRGKYYGINPTYEIKSDFLNREQRGAITHALTDRNSVTIIAGGAGTGKTTLMKEVRDGVEAAGKPFMGFAPSAAASRGVMRVEGFASADTLAQLLVNKELQEQTKNGVIWLDEAGLIGNKDMNRLFAIAYEQNARILLTGDIRQHASVAAGDALRILEREAGLPVARVDTIQRQHNQQSYKEAVQLAAAGKIDAALHRLDRMGNVIHEPDSGKRLERLVRDYQQTAAAGQTALVVSPTHIEGRNVSDSLRDALKQAGVIDGQERQFLQLKNTNWTEENKADPYHYHDRDYQLEFHQNANGHRRGERWKIDPAAGGDTDSVIGEREGKAQPIALAAASRFSVYRPEKLSIAKGDRIRLTKGGKTLEGTRVNNGDFFTVTGFTRKGDIKLHTGKVLASDYGHLTHGYVTTSHSSQGKTVDQVFIAQSSQSLPASGKQQFYVSISRGRRRCRIYTDDKQALEQAVMRDGQRMTARQVASRLTRKRRKHIANENHSPTLKPSQQQRHGNHLRL